jgi:hypothetical protein
MINSAAFPSEAFKRPPIPAPTWDDGKRRGNKYAKMAWLNEREHDGDRNKNQQEIEPRH